MQAHQLKIHKTAHYYTIGEIGPHIKKLWIACHGYGQLASKLIYKFEEIDDGETLIVAPEGLSRFYFGGGVTGKVAASWMTSGDRLVEIEDYCNWLDTIYNLFTSQLPSDIQINLFGFSQGVATIVRWVHARQPYFHNLIPWAGRIPEDISYLHLKEYLQDKRIVYVYGTKDQFLSDKLLEVQNQFIKEQELRLETVTFEDRHIVHRPTLKMVSKMIVKTIST